MYRPGYNHSQRFMLVKRCSQCRNANKFCSLSQAMKILSKKKLLKKAGIFGE
jgi:hypothetical protein